MLYQMQTLQNLERKGKNGLQIQAKILGGGGGKGFPFWL